MSLVLIREEIAAASATLEFGNGTGVAPNNAPEAFDGTFKFMMLKLVNVRMSSATFITAEPNVGGVWQATGWNMRTIGRDDGTPATLRSIAGTGVAFTLMPLAIGNAADDRVNLAFYFYDNVQDLSYLQQAWVHGAYENSLGTSIYFEGAGGRTTGARWDGIRVVPGAGTFTSGAARLYGFGET